MTYERSDSAVCECCNLPTCEAKKPGVGYVCQPCLAHYHDGTGPPGTDSGQDVPWEHEKLAFAVQATLGYAARHPEAVVSS